MQLAYWVYELVVGAEGLKRAPLRSAEAVGAINRPLQLVHTPGLMIARGVYRRCLVFGFRHLLMVYASTRSAPLHL